MKVTVEPLIGIGVSTILKSYGFDAKQLDLFDYFQNLGEVYLGRINGELICCWGLVPPSFLATQAYLWMWAPEPMKHQLVFVRHSQIVVRRMLDRYDEIIGDCMITARSSQRWLKWLGAEFGKPKDNIIPFSIRKPHG